MRLGAFLLLLAFFCGCGAPRTTYRTTPDGKPWLSPRGRAPIPEAADRAARKRFQVPVEGTVSSGFGGREGGRHAGVDLIAPKGTEVRAAELGIVVYAGEGMRGYGKAVVLDHGEGVTTLYGHLDAIHVESGDAVPAGAPIGTVGRSGNATTYHLHFEIRVDGEPVDPLAHLVP
ncbi:MAG: LysM peptidoglycan-binding protein [Deltaproteobacteria bacterium]|nr:LysM peptidoglycan-binding protein [Deltaproteobacteria bacterium]